MVSISFTVGSFAFQICSSLSEVILTNGLTTIGASMFFMSDGNGNPVPTSLGSIIIPSTVTNIGR